MTSTRQLKDFKVRNTEGNIVTVQRRCAGSGVSVQKQMDSLVYDEKTKKFRQPTKEDRTKKTVRGDHVIEDLTTP